MYRIGYSIAFSIAAACAGLALAGRVGAAEFERNESAAPPAHEQGFFAASDTFSVIAIPQADHLKLLLERFGAAQAITGAKIELHSTEQRSSASELGGGAYRADGLWLLEPGKKALAVTISAEGEHDVLVIVFDPAQGGANAAPRESKYGPRGAEAQAQ